MSATEQYRSINNKLSSLISTKGKVYLSSSCLRNFRKFFMYFDSKNPKTESTRKCLKTELRVYYGPSQDMVLCGFSADMSIGGLFLKTETPFSVDEKIMLSFTLPDESKLVTCRAKVAWVNLKDEPLKPELPQGIGIQFVDLPEEHLELIQNLLNCNEVEPVF